MYRKAVEGGLTPADRSSTLDEQVESWRRAAEHALAISEQVCGLLARLGVEPGRFCEYIGFALRLDRYRRRFSLETLRQAAHSLVLTWSARPLDREVLEAICRLLLSPSDPDEAAGSSRSPACAEEDSV